MTDDFKFSRLLQQSSGDTGGEASPQSQDMGPLVHQAAVKLMEFLDPKQRVGPESGPWRPLLILSFDESHKLADILVEKESLFVGLRRALHTLVGLPIFSLFLSTTAKFRLFSPETDPKLELPSPISEISFDDLAFPAIEDTVSLDEVTGDKWISHLGRPLYEFQLTLVRSVDKLTA